MRLAHVVAATWTVIIPHVQAGYTRFSGACRADANEMQGGEHMKEYIKYQRTGSNYTVTDIDHCKEVCTHMTANTTNNQTCHGIEYLISNGVLDYCEVWIVPIQSVKSVDGNWTCEQYESEAVVQGGTSVSSGGSGNSSSGGSGNSSSGGSSSSEGSGNSSSGGPGNSSSQGSGSGSGNTWSTGTSKFTINASDGNFSALNSLNSTQLLAIESSLINGIADTWEVAKSDITKVAFYDGSIITEVQISKKAPPNLEQTLKDQIAGFVSTVLVDAGVCPAPCETIVQMESSSTKTGEVSSAWRAIGALPIVGTLLWLWV